MNIKLKDESNNISTKKVIFSEIQTDNNNKSLLSVISKSNFKCQLSVNISGVCQSTPFRPSDKSLTDVITILRQILIPHAGYT